MLQNPRQESNQKFHFFADDAAAFITNVKKNIKKTREALRDYEEATGAKLHDGKTKVLQLGANKDKDLNLQEEGIEFEVMKTDQSEKYLGGLVGNEIDEEASFTDPLEKLKKVARIWRAKKIGLHARVLVANTILLQASRYRASFNTISKEKLKEITMMIQNFIWKGKRAKKRWSCVVQSRSKAGLGAIDPQCAYDAEKISRLAKAGANDNHPWVSWKKRKDQKIRNKWGIVGKIEAIKTNRKLKWNKNDFFEQAYEAWHEISESKITHRSVANRFKEGVWWNPNVTKNGITFYVRALHAKGIVTIADFVRYMDSFNKNGGKRSSESLEVFNAVEKYLYAKVAKSTKKIGTTLGDKWKNFDTMKCRDCTEKLKEKRFPSNARPSQAITTIRKFLTTRELDFWWKVNHNLVVTNAQAIYFNSKQYDSRCDLCVQGKETRAHLNGGCPMIKKIWEEAAKEEKHLGVYDPDNWNLDYKFKVRGMIVAAKLRYAVDQYKVQMNLKRRRRGVNIDLVLDNWRRAVRDFDSNFKDSARLQELMKEEERAEEEESGTETDSKTDTND